MKAEDIGHLGCPWFQHYLTAAYAADAIVRLLARPPGFASPDVRRLYRSCSGFALRTAGYALGAQGLPEDARFAGAVLSKLSQRGVPAPCSLIVERHILCKAQEADVLEFDERIETGEFEFYCHPRLERLDLMVKACLLPELLVGDKDIDSLLECYRSLCTEPERDFFDQLTTLLPDRRLALLVLPQRQMGSMLLAKGSPFVATGDRVDFAIEIPYFIKNDWLRVAIEIDDESHTGAQAKQDEARDKALRFAQWEVQRFRLKEANEWEPRLRQLVALIRDAVPDNILKAAEELRNLPLRQRRSIQGLVLLPVAEAQMTAALADLLYRGGTAEVTIGDPQELGLHAVVQAVAETLEAILTLHGMDGLGRLQLAHDESEKPDLLYYGIPSGAAWDTIRSSNSTIIAPGVVLHDYVYPLLDARPRPVDLSSPDRTEAVQRSLRHFLQNVFRKVEFRGGQVEILERALTLHPVIGLLPTAAGKSLCYQLASFTQPGFTLVVAPLRSLMFDQEENLKAMGIHRCLAIVSGREATEIEDRWFREKGYRSVENGHQIFVFVAPERLQMPDFRGHVKSFSANVPIPYCVVDEAHCVSEWGHDFRPAYLNVGRLVRTYCEHDGMQPSLLALTGTASRNVIIDIVRELEIEDQEAVIEPKSFDRKELEFEIYKVSTQDRMAVLAGKLRSILTGLGWRPGQPGEIPSGLIFTYFVDDRSIGVPRVAEELSTRLNLPIELYSGKSPIGIGGTRLDWEQRKLETQRRFKRNEVPILVCTHSFGMGIDKPNIRFTVHVMLPRSLEEFYQHSGRAGRDGKPSRCVVIFADDQPRLAEELLNTEQTSLEEITVKASQVPWDSQGDAIRNTWFLTNNFLGRDLEKALLQHVISQILLPRLGAHPADRVTFDVSFMALPDRLLLQGAKKKVSQEEKVTALEKALYRLLLVGAIVDYMKDYTGKKFIITLSGVEPQGIYAKLEDYLRRYAVESEVPSRLPPKVAETYEEATLQCGCKLIDYIYDTIEKRRRRAIGQMLDAAREAVASGANKFRVQLLAYLEESEFTKLVAELMSRIDPDEWFEVLKKVTGMDGITKLLGACRRQLEESPSHPGLLLLAGLCRIASPNPQPGMQDIRGSFIALKRHYSNSQDRLRVARQAIDHAEHLAPLQLDAVLHAILEGDLSLDLARFCYERAGTASKAHQLAITLLAQGILDVVHSRGTGA